MKDSMDKSLFFITLSFVCIWLIVDMAIGKNYVGNFLSIIFPFMASDTAEHMTTEEVEEAEKEAPTSSAMGGKKENTTTPGSLPYGATRK